MSRPVFTAELINDLKARVIAHNRAVEARGGGALTKLADVKRAYTRGHKGKSPGERAMAKVDDFLASLTLAKAGEFEENEHPRDGDGKFAHKGGAGRQAGASRHADRPETASQPKHPTSPIPLPETRVAHEALQEDNAGYRALTSGVLPTRQAEFEGSVIRDVGSVAAGTALAAALMRHRPPGATPDTLLRVARWAGKNVGSAIAGTVTGAATYAGTAVAGKVKAVSAAGARVVGGAASRAMSGVDGSRVYAGALKSLAERAAQAQASPPTYVFANRMTRKAMVGGRWAGRKVADIGIRNTGNLLHDIRASWADNASSPTRRALRHAGATVGVGGVLGYGIRSTIHGTPLDPQVIGMGIDAFSHRDIRKGDQLDETYDALRKVAHDGASFDDLRKAMRFPGQIGRIGMGALTAARALGGAVAGAGLAYGASRLTTPSAGDGKKGNPYHDDQGRFTSRDRAHTIAGGVVGALAAGALGLLAARRANAKVIPQVARRVDEFLARRLGRIKSAGGLGPVADAVKNRATHVDDIVAGKVVNVSGAEVKTPKAVMDWIAVKRLHEKHGAGAPIFYQERLRSSLNEELARKAAMSDQFLVGKATIGEIRARVAGGQRQGARVMEKAREAIGKLTSKGDFERAIANMPKADQDEMRRLWEGRDIAIGLVDKQVAAHAAALEVKRTEAAAAKSAVEQAKATLDTAAEALTPMAADAPGRAAAEATHNAANKAYRAAQTAEKDAQKALNDLHTQGADVLHPVSGERIPPLTPVEAQGTLKDLEAKAREAAGKSLDDVVKGMRDQQVAVAESQHARWMGAVAASSARYGTPKGARAARNALMRAQQAVREAEQVLSTARSGKAPNAALEHLKGFFENEAARHAAAVTEAEAALAAARKATGKNAAAAVTKAQNALNRATVAQASAKNNASKIITEAENAVANGNKMPKPVLSALEDKVAQAREQRAEAVAAFQSALNGANGPKPFLPQGVREALEDAKRDYGIIRGEVGKRLDAFLQRPSMMSLAGYARAAKEKTSKVATAAYRDAFYRQEGDKWVLSPGKIARGARWMKVPALVSAIGATGVGAEALGEWLGEHKKSLRDLRFEQNVDPNTGSGYIGLSLKDQNDPKERVFVWGVRQDDPNAPEKPIFAGGRVSAIRNQQQNGKGGGAPEQQNARDLPKPVFDAVSTAMQKATTETHRADFDGAPSVTFRRADDKDPDGKINNASGVFMNEVRKKAGDGNNGPKEAPPGGKFYDALNLLFSKQGSILQPKQIATLLTGWKRDGFSQGLFPKNEDLGGDAAEVATGLRAEFGNIMGGNKAPRDEIQRANLHRAAMIIGLARGVPASEMAAVHEIIRGPSTSTASGAANAGTSDAKAPFEVSQPSERQMTKPEIYEEAAARDIPMPSNWDNGNLKNLSETHAARLKGPLGIGGQTHDDGMLSALLRTMAKQVHHVVPQANMQASLAIAADALRATAMKSSGGDRTNMQNAVREQDWMEFEAELDNQIALWRQRMGKRAPAGSQTLEKINWRGLWDAAKHPRAPAGSETGGEFTSGSAAPGGIRRHVEAGAEHAEREHWLRHAQGSQGGMASDMPAERPRRGAPPPPQERSLLDPHRMAYEFGGMVGGAAGWSGVSRLVDKFKARSADKAVAAAISGVKPSAALRLARNLVSSGPGGMTLKLAGSMIAAAGTTHIAQAGVDAAYRVAGKKPPPHYEAPPAHDYGQLAAEFLAGTAGWTAGAAAGAIGGPVGSTLGGAAASYAAAEGGKRLYNWFAGYDPASVDKVSRRYLGSRA